MTWEYPSQAAGGAWAALPIAGDTTIPNPVAGPVNQPFRATGVGTISFRQPNDWRIVTTGPGAGFAGYWIRAVITVATGITRAQQQNRDIYTAVMGCVDIADTTIAGDIQVDGDLPALVKLDMHALGATTGGSGYGQMAGAIIGLRSLSRGADFRAFVNLSCDSLGGGNTEQNPPNIGITWGANTAPNVLPPAANYNTDAPAEYCARYAPAGVSAMQTEITVHFVNLSSPYIADQYRGVFHVFLRYRNTSGSAGDLRAKIIAVADSLSISSSIVELNADNEFSLLDFGRMDLTWGLGRYSEHDWGLSIYSWGFQIQVENTASAARVCFFYDLILIPADEWIGRFETISYYNLMNKVWLEVDSTRAESPLLATVHSWTASDAIYERSLSMSAGPAILQVNRDQRLWFLALQRDSSSGYTYSDPAVLSGIRLWRVNRYQIMRGTK